MMVADPQSGAASSVFVGRQLELAALDDQLAQVRRGSPALVVIEGPAGVGKTALVRRFLAGAAAAVVEASGDEAETLLPYGVLSQVLSQIPGATVGWQAKDPLEVGARLLPVLDALEADGPAIVVVDDAQWADAPSLRALTFAFRRLQADRVLALIVARDEPAALPEGLRRLASRGLHLRLAGLGADELAELALALGAGNLPRRASQRLFEHTRGNPLHARALFEELDRSRPWWTGSPLPAPQSFALLVLARLATCSPGTVGLVEAAAVLGQRCRLGLALDLAGLADPAAALDEAVAAKLLESDLRTIVFPHPLVRAAIYHSLGPAHRGALHDRAAALLDGPPALEHKVAACLVEDAVLAAEVDALAREEAGRGATAAAVAHLLAAARLSPDRPAREDRLLSAFELLLDGGEMADAVLLAPDIDACADSPRRLCLLGQFALRTGRLREGEELLEAAWNRCEAKSALAMRASADLAQLCAFQHRLDESVAWGRHSMAAVGPTTPAFLILVTVLAAAGQSDEALALLGAVGAPNHGVLAGLGIVKLWTDDLPGARQVLTTVVGASHDYGRDVVIALRFLAETEYRLGAWDESLVHAGLAASLATDIDSGAEWIVPMADSAVAWVASARGSAEAALHVRRANEVARRLGDTASELYALTASVHLGFCRRDPVTVLDAVQRILELPRHASTPEPSVHPWRAPHVDALVHLGRLEEAGAALEALEGLAEGRKRRSALAQAARARGSFEAARGRSDDARAAFEASLGYLGDLPMPFARALTEDAFGRFLRRQGERKAAARLFGTARECFVALGAQPFVDRTDAELRACGLTPRRRTVGAENRLSPQELGVARLVAQGATNKEVAAELVVSVKTVEHHLSSVYAKLGLRSRSQLAARLARPGIRGFPDAKEEAGF